MNSRGQSFICLLVTTDRKIIHHIPLTLQTKLPPPQPERNCVDFIYLHS